MMQNRYVGILVCDTNGRPPFQDQEFYRELAAFGNKAGLSVFIFSPAWVSWKLKKTWGYRFDSERGEWVLGKFPLPALIYDRSFYKYRRHLLQKRQFMKNIRSLRLSRLLGHSVGNKWEMQLILARSPDFRPFLPKTTLYRSPESLFKWLKKYKNAFLKPLSGCQGRGVFHMMETSAGTVRIRGRDSANRPIQFDVDHISGIKDRITPYLKQRKYLIQPALSLQTKSGLPYDVRALVQKNGRGVWCTTGIAVRLGRPGSVTANLHGGGIALKAEPFLRREFGETLSRHLLERIQRLCKTLPPYLEQYYGRMAELGLDFGVDQSGKVWILEVNSKPGRAAFSGSQAIRNAAIRQPLFYAKYLLERP